MPTTLRFAEDSADPLVIQLGTEAAPQSTSGMSLIAVKLRDLDTDEILAAGSPAFRSPASTGQVVRPWEAGESVAGRRYIVEVITQDSGGVPRTWPGAENLPLIVEIGPRRTTVE